MVLGFTSAVEGRGAGVLVVNLLTISTNDLVGPFSVLGSYQQVIFFLSLIIIKSLDLISL